MTPMNRSRFILRWGRSFKALSILEPSGKYKAENPDIFAVLNTQRGGIFPPARVGDADEKIIRSYCG